MHLAVAPRRGVKERERSPNRAAASGRLLSPPHGGGDTAPGTAEPDASVDVPRGFGPRRCVREGEDQADKARFQSLGTDAPRRDEG